jgi:hypothetical protein
MEEISNILDKKLKNNDKYLVKKILSYIYGNCDNCSCPVLNESDLILVYHGENCIDDQRKYCKNCLKYTEYCKYCSTFHTPEIMIEKDNFINMCVYCEKQGFHGWLSPSFNNDNVVVSYNNNS